MTNQLNVNEQKVLNALVKQQMDCTGGEFGHMPDVDRAGLSKHEFAGYIASLKQKGYFDYIQEADAAIQIKANYAIKQDFLTL